MEQIRSAIEKASGYLAENPDAATATDAAATAVRDIADRSGYTNPALHKHLESMETVEGQVSMR